MGCGSVADSHGCVLSGQVILSRSKTELTDDSPSGTKSQYHAALTMLRQAIEACPPELWTDASYVNPFWHVAYHTLFYTDFYLQPSESAFVPWEHHRPEHNFFASRSKTTTIAPYSVDEIRG